MNTTSLSYNDDAVAGLFPAMSTSIHILLFIIKVQMFKIFSEIPMNELHFDTSYLKSKSGILEKFVCTHCASRIWKQFLVSTLVLRIFRMNYNVYEPAQIPNRM